MILDNMFLSYTEWLRECHQMASKAYFIPLPLYALDLRFGLWILLICDQFDRFMRETRCILRACRTCL